MALEFEISLRPWVSRERRSGSKKRRDDEDLKPIDRTQVEQGRDRRRSAD